jgi:hypothetical protein
MRAMTYRSSARGPYGDAGAEASLIRPFFPSSSSIDALALRSRAAGPRVVRTDGALTRGERYPTGLSQTIGGGTKEIQRNIIGERARATR